MSAQITRPMAARLDQCGWLPPTEADYPTRKSALFVTLQDFIGIAGQVYVAAARGMEPDSRGRWLEECGGELFPYAHARDFHELLVAQFSERLYRHAALTGHFVPGQHAAWLRDDDDSSGCRGGAPAAMAQGCAASSPAVGSAAMVSQVAATASPADPLLLGPAMQELPVAGSTQPADIISTEGTR